MANTYVDEIKVKISEKYKPPFRISMPMSYSQRLTINKQMQDNRPTYNFHLERTVLDKVREWKDTRKNLTEERKDRLELAKKEFENRIQEEKLDRIEQEQAQARILEDTTKNASIDQSVTSHLQKTHENFTQPHNSIQHQPSFISSNGILMPTPYLSNPSNANILKPMPLQNTNFESNTQRNVKPFNLSDFESDTSSPFDNMELKSINDLEELAQVLKSEQNTFQRNLYPSSNAGMTARNYSQIGSSNNKNFSSYPQVSTNSSCYKRNGVISYESQPYGQDSSNYNPLLSSYSQINSNIPNFNQYNAVYNPQTTSYLPNTTSAYNFNGYAYKEPESVSRHSVMSYGQTSSVGSQANLQNTSCKSVPDLVKSLEKELENSHLNDATATASDRPEIRSKPHFYTTNNVQLPVRPKSTDAVYPKAKNRDEIFNPYNKLSTEQRDLCKGVSMMGFPLDRVARVCLIIGNDQKKIVDHLLALSDLLDLGFSESSASEALVKNNNDRDKALDLLIS
ncbi:ubiquitin-associated protein 1 [Sitophilus oryzae]|uniref:Ubiquitin-associated protein 1 n=1 Tax=Sitophilus oryzae TaxID=7048 RepID=A0A6J2XZK1_SITOR|nr:ubiquitin-associated protein 1 [Sitophilus oryzae]XP_030756888.1 ubiquitin-associated protein 1 [Sitophilus oryzae]